MITDRVYFHTNIVSPYRLHQFRYIAKVFPNHLICLYGKVARNNESVWTDDLDRGEPFHCVKFAAQDYETAGKGSGFFSFRLLWLLICQRWGTVHVVGAGVYKLNLWMLAFSGLIGHSKLILWKDGCLKSTINDCNFSGKLRFLWKHCARAAFASGQWAMMKAENLGIRREDIVNQYFSCDEEKFERFRAEKSTVSRDVIRKEFGIPNDGFCILTIARYVDWKRIVDVANALLGIECRNPVLAKRMTWILIGNGECKDHEAVVNRLRQIKVCCVPPMAADKVLSYYCAADVFAFPSEGDVWGLVINEALSMGVPVICTEEIGSACLVEDGVNGFLIPVRSPEALAKKLMQIAQDRQLGYALSSGALASMQKWKSSMGIDALEGWMQKNCVENRG